MIQYMEKIQNFLRTLKDQEGRPIVGGMTSVVDILKKVGSTALNDAAVPDSREKVAQYLFLFENGDLKKGKDLWKFVTRDGRKAQMWLQLKNGDNQQMNHLVSQLELFMAQADNAPPFAVFPGGENVQLKLRWSGLTYINSVWQNEMVIGMRTSLMGSFGVVFVMMIILFRSILWGLISMLPLSLTIVFTYGLIGFGGKYYDMPIAVLSSLALGLAIDFAIHFIQSLREIHLGTRNLNKTYDEIFQEPSRAIWRNVLVIAIGFMPMFFSGLATYVTVGAFFFAIMLVSGITTLILLPALIQLMRKWLPGLQEA
ncbi:MMPL family transporter [Deltaproteobacteria bacterium TL4]